MIIRLSLLIVSYLLNSLVDSCTDLSVEHGEMVSLGSNIGDSATLVCQDGYTTYTSHLRCSSDQAWIPTPRCHKVNVKFSGKSMIQYLFPISYDAQDSTISFLFSTPPHRNSGVLLRLSSEATRDEVTIEMVGGFLATTMQLDRKGPNAIGFCHDDTVISDNLQHRVVLRRTIASLSLTIDNRQIKCDFPTGSDVDFTFARLQSIQVGHLNPSWGSDYGFGGCMSELQVDGLAPLILADLAENTDMKLDQVTVEDVEFVESCGALFQPTTLSPPLQFTEPPSSPVLVTGKIRDNTGDGENRENDKSTLIIILVTIGVLLLLVLLIGVVCRKYYTHKGTYKVPEGATAEEPNPEQEYFI